MEFEQEHAAIEVGGTSLEVVSLEGEEAMSSLFRYSIECAVDAGSVAPDALLGGTARVTLRDGAGGVRQVTGIVAEAATRSADSGQAKLSLVVRPAFHALTLGRSCRAFRDKSAVEIVSEVLSAVPAPVRWTLSGGCSKRAYCAQVREDDWSFALRLLEEEGIFYWFDHGGGATTLVLSDSAALAPEIEGAIPFHPGTGGAGPHERVHEIGAAGRATATRFSVGSFDPALPSQKIAASEGEGIEVYDAPGGGPTDPAVIAARARMGREAVAAAPTGASGGTTSVRLTPGKVASLEGHARRDGRHMVTAMQCSVVQRRRGGDAPRGQAYACQFQASPDGAPFRPQQETPRTVRPGLSAGLVLGDGEVHPDGGGRVRIKQRWERDEGSMAGTWMRAAQRATAGSMALPRVGWTVMTLNEEGSTDAPSAMSRIYDAEHPPPYPLPAEATRVVVKTATTPGGGSFNEIRLEDKKGREEILLNASRDMRLLVKHAKAEDVTRDASRDVGGAHRLDVSLDLAERVIRDQRRDVAGDESLSVEQRRSLLVAGDEDVLIGGSRSLSVGDTHGLSVQGARSLSVGTALMDTVLGPISASAGTSHVTTVGGARVLAARKAISEGVGLASQQVVGGVKVELAKKDRSIAAKRGHIETVGAAMILKTAGAFRDSAKTTCAYTAGALLSTEAPELVATADAQIVLRCGASSITLTPEGIEIRAPQLDLTEAETLVAKGATIKHN